MNLLLLCLLVEIYSAFQIPWIANQDKRLILTSDEEPGVWLNQAQIYLLRVKGTKFIDITEHQDINENWLQVESNFPQSLFHLAYGQSITQLLSTALMTDVLKKLTSFKTRYYNSRQGQLSSEYLFDEIDYLINQAPSVQHNITLTTFEHKWKQKSIIAKIEGSKYPEEIIIVGAHQDSINQWLPWFGRAPGADDDGSGTVTILETFRVLIESGFTPDRSVEFHWYSAEEAGLLGSLDIAHAYQRAKKKVIAMMQMDMTGYFKDKESIALINDFTDPSLTDFLRKIVSHYTRLDSVDIKCGYGCSDHASWTKAGFRAASPFEDIDIENPYIHTPSDTFDHVDLEHSLEFAKVAVGFVVELALI